MFFFQQFQSFNDFLTSELFHPDLFLAPQKYHDFIHNLKTFITEE